MNTKSGDIQALTIANGSYQKIKRLPLEQLFFATWGAETTIAGECLAEVQKIVGEDVNVFVARKGLEVELIESRCPF